MFDGRSRFPSSSDRSDTTSCPSSPILSVLLDASRIQCGSPPGMESPTTHGWISLQRGPTAGPRQTPDQKDTGITTASTTPRRAGITTHPWMDWGVQNRRSSPPSKPTHSRVNSPQCRFLWPQIRYLASQLTLRVTLLGLRTTNGQQSSTLPRHTPIFSRPGSLFCNGGRYSSTCFVLDTSAPARRRMRKRKSMLSSA